jgi:hypothetical protein
MPKLIIKDIDPNAKGSFAVLRRVLKLQAGLRRREPEAMDAMIELTLQYASTDDGTPVEPLLAELSVAEFTTIAEHWSKQGGETIPNLSTPSS